MQSHLVNLTGKSRVDGAHTEQAKHAETKRMTKKSKRKMFSPPRNGMSDQSYELKPRGWKLSKVKAFKYDSKTVGKISSVFHSCRHPKRKIKRDNNNGKDSTLSHLMNQSHINKEFRRRIRSWTKSISFSLERCYSRIDQQVSSNEGNLPNNLVYPLLPVVIQPKNKLSKGQFDNKSCGEKKPDAQTMNIRIGVQSAIPRVNFMSDTQSKMCMGIPCVPPCSPALDDPQKVVPSLRDIKSQRQLRSILTQIGEAQRKKVSNEKKLVEERLLQDEKRKLDGEKRKLRQQQRAEIYALNKILSALENERFEKLKYERFAAPV